MTDVKVTKKDIQEAKRPDALLEGATSVYDWLVERRNLVIGVGVGLAVILVGVSFARASSEKRTQEVGAQLAAALELADRPVIESKETPAPDAKNFASAEAKTQAVQKALGDIISQHAGTEAARTAQLQLAGQLLSAGKPEEAIAGFEKYLAEVSSGGLRLFAVESLGYAYEAKGDLTKAAEVFQKLADQGAPGVALFHKARLAEKAGKKDEAKAGYEQVAKDYSSEQVANEARTRLELIDVPPAGQGELKAPVVEPVEEQPVQKGKKKPVKPVVAPKPLKKKVK